MLTIKRVIQGVTILAFASYVLFSLFYFCTNELHPKYVDCGIIQSKPTEEVAIKYGTSTELYLNVDFDNSGVKIIKVKPETFYLKQKGERVCFNLDKEESEYHGLFMLSGLFFFIAIISVLFVLFFRYLFF